MLFGKPWGFCPLDWHQLKKTWDILYNESILDVLFADLLTFYVRFVENECWWLLVLVSVLLRLSLVLICWSCFAIQKMLIKVLLVVLYHFTDTMLNSQVLYIEASLLVDQYCRRGCFQKQTWKWVSMVSLGVFLSPEIPPPICPFSQPFQVIRFSPSPGFSPSSLKDRICLHGLKIVELAENILKFLDQVGKKNI